ncbi:MAG: MATE family efflux transporter [Myxococcales bacterium]|nr:MATE family efflux transporter [Myxococcales bacterium]
MPHSPDDTRASGGGSSEGREGVSDPEAAPPLPAATLASGAGWRGEPAHGARAGYAEIWSLSWPVMLAQVLANAVSLIDIAMVGRLGSNAVAAVGYAAQFFFLAQSVLFAVGFACVALMARAIGAGDAAGARQALVASLAVAAATALAVMAAVLAAPRPLLRLLGADAAIVDATIPYLTLLMGSTGLLAVSVTLESGLRADRDTRTPMQIAVAVAAVKTALNLVLIFGALGFPRLELVGAGLATVVSQAVGVCLFAAVVIRARPSSPLALRAGDLVAAVPRLREVVRITLPGVGERLVMNLAILAYFRVLSDFGPVAIAAYTVGIRILSFSWIPGTAFATAAATLVGQALGSGDPGAAARAGWRATRLALVVAVTLGALCALARAPLARLFTNDAALVAELGPFLLCLAIAQPFLQAHFTLGGAHRGAGDTWTPLIAATVGNWALRVPLAVLFAYVLRTPVVWVWYALVFDHLARTAWLAWSFQRGAWRHTLSTAPAR